MFPSILYLMHCAIYLHWDDEISIANRLWERNKRKTEELWHSIRWETNVEKVTQLSPQKIKFHTFSEIPEQPSRQYAWILLNTHVLVCHALAQYASNMFLFDVAINSFIHFHFIHCFNATLWATLRLYPSLPYKIHLSK